jgi:hypothetical protein
MEEVTAALGVLYHHGRAAHTVARNLVRLLWVMSLYGKVDSRLYRMLNVNTSLLKRMWS